MCRVGEQMCASTDRQSVPEAHCSAHSPRSELHVDPGGQSLGARQSTQVFVDVSHWRCREQSPFAVHSTQIALSTAQTPWTLAQSALAEQGFGGTGDGRTGPESGGPPSRRAAVTAASFCSTRRSRLPWQPAAKAPIKQGKMTTRGAHEASGRFRAATIVDGVPNAT